MTAEERKALTAIMELIGLILVAIFFFIYAMLPFWIGFVSPIEAGDWVRIITIVLFGIFFTPCMLGIGAGITFPGIPKSFKRYRAWRRSPYFLPCWVLIARRIRDIVRDWRSPSARKLAKKGWLLSTTLPAEVRDIISPLLPANGAYVRPEHLPLFIAHATRLMRAREEYTRQEKAAIERQTDLDLARALAVYLAGLTPEEKALFAARRREGGANG